MRSDLTGAYLVPVRCGPAIKRRLALPFRLRPPTSNPGAQIVTPIKVAFVKLSITFRQGELPPIDPADPRFVLELGGLKIAGQVNAKAARKLAAHQGGAVLNARLAAEAGGALLLSECGFTWLEPRTAAGSEQPVAGSNH
jgi:hypothetical protein